MTDSTRTIHVRLAVLAALMGLILIACGSDASDQTTADEPTPTASETTATGGGSDTTAASGGSTTLPAEEPETGEPTSLRIVPVSPSPLAWSFFYLPQALGWYEEEGLDVEIIGQIPRQTQTSMLTLNRVDAAHVSIGEIVQYGAEAKDLVWVGVTDGYNLNIYVPEDSDIQTSEDLIGATIGTREVGDDILVETLMGISGIDSSQYQTLPTGGGRGALADIVTSGQAAAIFGSPIGVSFIQEAGVTLRPVDTGASYAWPNAGLTIRRSDLEASPDVYAALGRAIAKGQVWTQVNPESTIELLGELAPESVQDPESSLRIREILNEVNASTYENRWTVDLDVLQRFVDVQAEIGVFDEPYDASEIFTDELLDEIWSFDVETLEQAAEAGDRDSVLGLNQ